MLTEINVSIYHLVTNKISVLKCEALLVYSELGKWNVTEGCFSFLYLVVLDNLTNLMISNVGESKESIEIVIPTSPDEDGDSDHTEILESDVPTMDEALAAINTVKQYMASKSNSQKLVTAVYRIENEILKDQLNKMKQEQMNDILQVHVSTTQDK